MLCNTVVQNPLSNT